ncbi:MAG: LysR family transcriptional regulator [Myxococcota bacterium]
MLNDIEQLRVFVQVVRSGSMVAAARVLSLPPNTVSRRIASLEQALERTLLVRTTRRLELSDEGRRLLEHARRILEAVKSAEDDLQATDRLRGRLRVGLGSRTVTPALLERIAGLLRDNPELSLALEVSDEPFDLVAQGLDIAVVGGPLADSTLVAVRLIELYAGLAAHPRYLDRAGCPRRRDELIDHECLQFRGLGQPTVWRLTDRHGAAHDVRVGGRFMSNNSQTLSKALFAGLGIGLVPLPFGEQGDPTEELVRVLPSYRWGPLSIYAVMHPSIAKTARVRAVLALLREQVHYDVHRSRMA